ncbi:MAG TPA: hypothetical protein VNO43_08925 [Candidatus Eisenbacteria bacterium]|nr:hypothetical protein [Candidatus Eisenbacteria bacterium]
MRSSARPLALALLLALLSPNRANGEETIEKAGVIAGLTLGNTVFLPAKAAAVGMGLLTGALSILFFGGDRELATQIWRDTAEGPYIITPELAASAVGHRPELKDR